MGLIAFPFQIQVKIHDWNVISYKNKKKTCFYRFSFDSMFFKEKKIRNPSIADQLWTVLKIYCQMQQTNEKEFNDRCLDANY